MCRRHSTSFGIIFAVAASISLLISTADAALKSERTVRKAVSILRIFELPPGKLNGYIVARYPLWSASWSETFLPLPRKDCGGHIRPKISEPRTGTILRQGSAKTPDQGGDLVGDR